MKFKEFYMIEVSDITKEMEDWFEERTNRHINLVKKYAKLVEEYDPIKYKGIINQVENHDASKFEEPERIPYIKLTWKHKFDNYKSYKIPGKLDDEEINKATLHHVLNNNHHPEKWQDKQKDLINKQDRDKPPKEIVDGTKMPDMQLIEMFCDWSAMSEELKKNTVKEWADKNINIRWKFTDDQKDLIYDLINNVKAED